MVQSCKESLKKVRKVLHTSVIYSHLFYILVCFVALYTKHYLVAFFAILTTVISIKHHSDMSNKIFSTADVITASISGILIFIYSIYIVWKHKIPIKNKTSNIIVTIIFIVITSLAFLFYYLARKSPLKSSISVDPDKGISGPIFVHNIQTEDEETCRDISYQINYIYYHTLWHIFGGIAGLFIIILITN